MYLKFMLKLRTLRFKHMIHLVIEKILQRNKNNLLFRNKYRRNN
jgi:hypothetical protein